MSTTDRPAPAAPSPVAAPASSAPRAIGWGRSALLGLGTIVAATVANLRVSTLGGLFVADDPRFLPLANPVGTLFFTVIVIPAVGAVLLDAALLAVVRRPAPPFTTPAAIVLAVSRVPDLTSIPTVPGASNGQTAIRRLMHVVAAAVITGLLTTVARERAR
jgi:hypothetical protein